LKYLPPSTLTLKVKDPRERRAISRSLLPIKMTPPLLLGRVSCGPLLRVSRFPLSYFFLLSSGGSGKQLESRVFSLLRSVSLCFFPRLLIRCIVPELTRRYSAAPRGRTPDLFDSLTVSPPLSYLPLLCLIISFLDIR